MRKLLTLICMISFAGNGILALAFDETCLHQTQEQAHILVNETSQNHRMSSLTDDKPCHETHETTQLDSQKCDRSCLCVHSMTNVPIFDFGPAPTAITTNAVKLRYGRFADAPAFFGQTPLERPPKSIS